MYATKSNHTTITSLPTEILDIVLSNLDRHHIAACVLVNQEWFKVFSPCLWRSISYIKRQQKTLHFHGDLTLESRFFLRLKSCIEAGALVRNGHWIQNIDLQHYETATLLATYGQTCTNLLDLKILFSLDPVMYLLSNEEGGEEGRGELGSAPFVDLSPLITILQRNPRLRSLTLEKEMLDERNPDFERLMDSIPTTIESLGFEKWDPIYSSRRFYFEQQEETASSEDEEHEKELRQQEHGTSTNNSMGSCGIHDNNVFGPVPASSPTAACHLPSLKRLSFKNYALDHQKDTLRRLLPRCPNLETILLDINHKVMPLKFFSLLLQQHCPRLRNLFILDGWDAFSDEGLADILCASTAGWKSLGLPQQPFDPHVFGPLSVAALLRHADTIENLRLDGSSLLPSSAIQQLLSSAPNLRRLDAILKDRSLEADFELDANDVASGKPWVCTKLESLKVRIVGVPRPDLTKRVNGRPLEDPLHQGTLQESRRIQRGVYHQLGRLTSLKQLVLGHDDVDVNRACQHYEKLSEGEYYREGDAIQRGYQYECLEMTVESGMNAMAGLKELRVLELGAMEVGKMDEGWTKQTWPRLGSGYKDTFWTDLGYREYS